MFRERVHKPVMLRECLQIALSVKPHLWADLTLGQGGHTEEVLRTLWDKYSLPKLAFLSDVSESMIDFFRREVATKLPPVELKLLQGWMHESLEVLGDLLRERGFVRALVLFDLGLSMAHLKFLSGFSFQHDSPLDMRLTESLELTAEKLLKTYSVEKIALVLREYGELRNALKIARSIKEQVKRGEMRTTSHLVRAVKRVVPERVLRHTLQRVFQALRLAVNSELDSLRASVELLLRLTQSDNTELYLIFLTYHSLERKLIKALRARYQLLLKLKPSESEIADNPPSRSAILYLFSNVSQGRVTEHLLESLSKSLLGRGE